MYVSVDSNRQYSISAEIKENGKYVNHKLINSGSCNNI